MPDPVQMAHEAITAGRLGAITFATWRFGGEVGTSTHPHANLIETQCHGFDMLEHLCGPIASVSAHMSDPAGTGYTTMAVALTFASGAVGASSGPTTRRTPTPRRTTSRSTAPPAGCRSSTPSSGSPTRRPATRSAEVWEAGYFNDRDRDFDHMFELHLDDSSRRCGGADEPPIHARAGRRALQLAEACIQSFDESRQVAVVKITGVTTYLVGNRWKNWLFVRVDTDEGIHGLGEGSLNGFCRTVEAAVHELEALVVGRDPFAIESLGQRLGRDLYSEGGQIHGAAMAAIEVACWDIKGKALGRPAVPAARRARA